MQISSINPSFSGRRDNIDAVINMDDKAVRDIAYVQTASNFDHEKSRKITKALFYSAPLAAGLGVAILGGGKNSKIFSKEVTGLAARASRGLKVAGVWTAGLAAIDALMSAKNKLADNSKEVRHFDKKHPVMSMLASLAGAFVAFSLVEKGAVRLGRMKAPKALQNIAVKADKFLNSNNGVQRIKKALLKWADKTPISLRDIGSTLLSWSPAMLLFGGLFHSIGSTAKENKEFFNNYNALKQRQANLAQARLRELSLQNDFLMQDARNREDLAILKNPKTGLAEIIEEA